MLAFWKYLFYNKNGEICHSFTQLPTNLEELLKNFFLLEVVKEEAFDVFNYYVKNNKLVAKPSKPGDNFFFNCLTENWEIISELEPSYEEKATSIRIERNSLLANSDWSQLADVNVNLEAWKSYRQLLRDITNQETFPETVTWPIPPQ